MSTLHFNALVPPFDLGEGTAVEELEKANLLTYGADSTGVAPSDTALKEALENSSIVYAPKGTYLFNEEHKIKGQVVIYGDGQMLTTLKTTSTTNATIIEFLNAGSQIHDLRLEGPTGVVTGGVLLSFTEETFDESGLESGTTNPKGWTEARHITTVGGFIQVQINKCVGVVIKDWIGTHVRSIGLSIFGERPGKACNLIYMLDSIVSGKKGAETVAGSIAIKATAGEALTFAHVDTEYCEVGMEIGLQTENSWFTDCFFDATQGTGLVVGNVKGCNFDKVWANSEAIGGGLIIGINEAGVENCTFSNCWFFSNTGELAQPSAIWKEISETEYNALASKKGTWVRAKVYAAKDGVFVEIGPEEIYPPTGGGRRFYEAQKATTVLSPVISGGARGQGGTYAWKVSTEYKLKDAVTESGKFYENIKALTAGEDTEPRKPTGAEGATFWKEVTEVAFNEGDFKPISPANGITVGPNVHEVSLVGCGVRASQNNGIHIERPAIAAEQNLIVTGCQLNEYKGFGLRAGLNQENLLVMGNQFISVGGRGAIANDSIASSTVVFNTGAKEFLTARMSKPAEQQAALEGVQQFAATAAANVRAQLVTYKTKADVETKVKHTLNSTCVLSVVAYKYVTSKYGSKMELAAKHVESFTVNSASEITIKWSATLEAKEEIAIVIQAA